MMFWIRGSDARGTPITPPRGYATLRQAQHAARRLCGAHNGHSPVVAIWQAPEHEPGLVETIIGHYRADGGRAVWHPWTSRTPHRDQEPTWS